MKQILRTVSLLFLLLFLAGMFASRCSATVEPELTTAIRQKNVQRALTLLSEGVNANERDEGAERTPLMWAAQIGNVEIVESLLHHGAAVNAKDDFGKTALALARENGHSRISQLLLDRGAKTAFHRAKPTAPQSVAQGKEQFHPAKQYDRRFARYNQERIPRSVLESRGRAVTQR